MASFKIFQLEKNIEDIRKTVLTNIIKMFVERKLINPENEQTEIDSVTTNPTDDNIYIINIDNYTDEIDKTYIVKLLNQKISGLSKQSNVSEFLNKYQGRQKLLVIKSITPKLSSQIKNNYVKSEVFVENELMINLIENILIPKYEILFPESEQYKEFYDQYQCKKRNIPKLYIDDPMAKYYNLKKGDIVRVIRPSETTAESPFYRLVI
jgi:DNA-directed RNA polymerase subunit H (RpoH/RPB5)